MATITATKHGKELTLWVTSDDRAHTVQIGTAMNLPDAKLDARKTMVRLLTALERVTSVDVKEETT